MSHPALDDLVAARSTATIQAHLAACARCRVQLRLHDASERPPSGPETEQARLTLAATVVQIREETKQTLAVGLTGWQGPAAQLAPLAPGPDPSSFVPTEQLGSGPQGDCWLARRRGEGDQVVLKVLRGAPAPHAIRSRFARLRAVHHPSLGRITSLAKRDSWYLVREFVPGMSPLDWLIAGDPLTTLDPPSRARRLIPPLVAGLARLHEVGLAHGAVSSGNVRVRTDGRPVLLDPLLTAPPGTPGDDWRQLGALLHSLLAGSHSVPLPPTTPDDLAALIGYLRTDPTSAGVLRRAMELPPPLILSPDRFVDQGLLGRGGMSEIRKVFDPVLGRTLALKIGPPAGAPQLLQERFLGEAQASAQLQHPGVVAVHDVGRTHDGRACFTMDVIRGDTLTAILARTGPAAWPLRRVIRGLISVCETLAYAHSCGVVHRDLKPDNVMFGPFGEVYVLDWGIAKVVDEPTSATVAGPRVATIRQGAAAEPTRPGQIVGTPAFMAPEIARGMASSVDARLDVYGVGALLYTALAGRPPHRARTVKNLLAAVGAGYLVDVMDAAGAGGRTPPERLAAICRRAMAADSADRHPSVRALRDDLESWMATDST
mgnify:CR=1 FL=1